MSDNSTSKRTPVTRSRWLSELVQRADRHLDDFRTSGLGGDKRLAQEACQAVERQATTEERPSVAETYARKRVDLDL